MEKPTSPVRLATLKPTSLERLDPQRAKFYSTAETTLCPGPPRPRMPPGCPSRRWRLCGKQRRMHIFCSRAGQNTPCLMLHRVFVRLKQTAVSPRASSCAGGKRRASDARRALLQKTLKTLNSAISCSCDTSESNLTEPRHPTTTEKEKLGRPETYKLIRALRKTTKSTSQFM